MHCYLLCPPYGVCNIAPLELLLLQCSHAAHRLFLYKAKSMVPVRRVMLHSSHCGFPRRVSRHQSNHLECMAGEFILSHNPTASYTRSIALHGVILLSKFSICSFFVCRVLFWGIPQDALLQFTRQAQTSLHSPRVGVALPPKLRCYRRQTLDIAHAFRMSHFLSQASLPQLKHCY